MNKVVIDTDYFRFITNDLSDSTLFLNIMSELEYEPVMHEFVYKEELHEHSFVKKLVDEGCIEIINYDSLTYRENDKKDYQSLFYMSYNEMNGMAFDSKRQIKNYHKKEENLGEIHSAILARIKGYTLMLSNDGGAKTFIHTKLNTARNHIRVVNIVETFTELLSPDTSALKWSDIKGVLGKYKKSKFESDKAKYKQIHDLWLKQDEVKEIG